MTIMDYGMIIVLVYLGVARDIKLSFQVNLVDFILGERDSIIYFPIIIKASGEESEDRSEEAELTM